MSAKSTEATRTIDPASARTCLVQQQQRLLSERVRALKLYYDSTRRVDDSDHTLDDIWPFITAFDGQLEATIKRVESSSVDEIKRQPRAMFGWFQKRLRRLKSAHNDLERLSKKMLCHRAYIPRTELLWQHSSGEEINVWDVPFFMRLGGNQVETDLPKDIQVEAYLRDMHLPSDLRQISADSLNDLIQMQIPAILAAQACAYAILVTSIADVLHELVVEARG